MAKLPSGEPIFWKDDPKRLEPVKPELLIRDLSTVDMRALTWLWTGWIPQGYITIWAGESGAGKSTVLADVAARVTTGQPWPGEPNHSRRSPSRVLWLGSEDGIEELTVPRLAACGADLTKITEIRGTKKNGVTGIFSLQDDVLAVMAVVNNAWNSGKPYSMLVIDPITSYLSGQRLRKVDLNDAGQLRSILEPWLIVAQKYNLAIVCVTHFMKDTNRAMIHRVLGTAAFAQTCRSLCAVVARLADGLYAKALIQVKVNLPDHPGGAWKFKTVKVQVGDDRENGKAIFATRAEWDALDSTITADGPPTGGSRGPASQFADGFSLWVAAKFRDLGNEHFLEISALKSAAIEAGVASESWWNDHSAHYLEKRNRQGVWVCRPKTIFKR